MRFTRVVLGVSSSPFLLNATIRNHLKKYSSKEPEFVEIFLRSIYVDDVSLGSDDEDGAFVLYESILAEGGFNLRKFITNPKGLQKRIEQSELRLVSKKDTNPKGCTEEDVSYAKNTLGGTPAGHGEQV